MCGVPLQGFKGWIWNLKPMFFHDIFGECGDAAPRSILPLGFPDRLRQLLAQELRTSWGKVKPGKSQPIRFGRRRCWFTQGKTWLFHHDILFFANPWQTSTGRKKTTQLKMNFELVIRSVIFCIDPKWFQGLQGGEGIGNFHVSLLRTVSLCFV